VHVDDVQASAADLVEVDFGVQDRPPTPISTGPASAGTAVSRR
jgi:hypothetical protein